MDNKNVKPFTDAIGNLKLAETLFGDKTEITWLRDSRWEYSRMTLTRDGKIDWKDEDKYDHDTTCFKGTYVLTGTESEFTVIARGDSTAYYDAYKGTESRHHDKDARKEFHSSRFTGKEFTFSRK